MQVPFGGRYTTLSRSARDATFKRAAASPWGVAGFVQGGGFGSLSKQFGTGAANLLEAEVVTTDGRIRVVNKAEDPELFFALRGGGGGTFGIVTRLTLRTHPLTQTIGAVIFAVQAKSDAAWRALD